MSEIQDTLPATPPAQHNLIEVIERAVMNPEVDLGKMQQLLDMQITIQETQAKQAFRRDFALMQSEFPSVEKRGKTQQSKYATFDDINDATKNARAKYGFGLSFQPVTDDGFMKITATLTHHQGHTETTSMTLPFDTTGNKNDVQAIGSAIKYGMRYGIVSLLSISTHDGDDQDGMHLHQKVTEEQAARLLALLESSPRADHLGKVQGFLTRRYGVDIESFADVPAARFADCERYLLSNPNG